MGLASGKSPTVHTLYQFCIMHVWTLSVLLLTSLAGGRASPLQKRYFDFDGNGLPDLCYQICELSIRCLLVDGTWTTIPSSQQLHSATDAGPLSFITAPGQTQTTSDIATASSLAEVLKSITTSTSSTTASAAVSSSITSSSAASSSFSTTVSTTPLSSPTSAFSTSFTVGSDALLVQRTTGKSSSSTKASTTSTHSSLPTGKLPSPSQFKADKGDKWTLDYMGDWSTRAKTWVFGKVSSMNAASSI